VGERILITGAAGFIGSHLTEAVATTGARVRALVHYNSRNHWGWLEQLPADLRANVEVVSGDITDAFFVRSAVAGCDAVYHLAAEIAIPYSYVAPASYVACNVGGTLNILQACKDEGVRRLVHTSTSETYGSAQYVPIDERHPLVAQSPYAASKIGADKLVESYVRTYGLPAATIRPFNTFGPRQSARAIIPTIITQALSGASEIHVGSLSPVRDLTFVADTAAGFMAIMGSDACVGQVTNIGRGSGITIGDLAATILRLCESDARLVSDQERVRPAESEVLELVCDASLAAERCGWRPSVGLEEGLARTIAWFRSNAGSYKAGLYNV